MKIATWNVNSVRARLPNVLEWLTDQSPDVLLLQETKTISDNNLARFIDAREAEDYSEGHIKGALFITVDDILSRYDELPQDKRLMFICEVGVRSGLACEMAAAMGYDTEKLYNVEDGTGSWIQNGHPTSKGSEL